MRKEMVLGLLLTGLLTGVQAGGDIGGVVSIENEVIPVEIKEPVKVEPKKEEVAVPKKVEEVVAKEEKSNFYVVAKGISIMGDDADSGYGAGLDIGYKINDSLAIELGGSYSENDLDVSGDEASYTSARLSLVYTVHATDDLGIFAKAGYMTEQIEVDAQDIDDDESDFVFGGGISYNVTDTIAVVGEYEASNIDSTRGDAISLGLKYDF